MISERGNEGNKIMRKFFNLILTISLLGVLSFLPVKAQTNACAQLKVTTSPADYGNIGKVAFTRQTIQNPISGAPAPVTVFLPNNASATNKVPVIFFAHGFGGFNYQVYEGLLNQLASNGYAVVFAPYNVIAATHAARYDQLWKGFQAAVAQYGNVLDISKIGVAGHSYGAGAVPEMARRAIAEGWGASDIFLFVMAAWYSWGTDYTSIPARAKLVVQIYWDDGTNEHLISQNDIWNRLPQITERRWQVIRTSTNCACTLIGGHGVPVTADVSTNSGGYTNAHDLWGVWRRIHALADYTFNRNQAAKNIAFGDDANMGKWRFCTKRPVTPMEAANAPVVNTSQSATWRWSQKCLAADSGFPCS
jgi:dienelactone hydrolase